MLDCLLPQVMASVVWTPGAGTVLPFGLELPAGLHAPAPPPGPVKTSLGDRLAYSQDTENFSLQWRDGAIAVADVEQIGAGMEAAWSGLVEIHGWEAPTTAASHLITVILDPTLPATGLTYAEPTADFPAGVPLIYINSTYAYDAAFMTSLCAHEFAHALQFRWRDWYTGGDLESWYWEASAEWQAELAVPEADAYSWSSIHYAAAPHAAFHSMADYHQYGMFLLNAYLDEYETGEDGLRTMWQDNTGADWLDEIAAAVGREPGRIWADFAGAYWAGALRESALYTLPVTVDGTTELNGWLGHHYIPLGMVEGRIALDGGIGTVVRDGDWQVFEGEGVIPEGAGEVGLIVTNPDRTPLRYSVTLLDGPVTDTGAPQDDTGAEQPDLDGNGELPEDRQPNVLGEVSIPGAGCACDGIGGGAALWWALAPVAVRRRRRVEHR